MAKTEAKTKETTASVPSFLKKIADEDKRKDCIAICEIYEKLTRYPAKMWGPAIVGFGSYHYVYESGHEGDAPLAAFSPRANAIVFYLGGIYDGKDELMEQLGKHKATKGCVYVKKLSDINLPVLKKMISASLKYYKAKYPAKK